MINQLKSIILQKQHEVAILKKIIAAQTDHPIADILSGKSKRVSKKSFKNALCQSQLAVIAEIKRKSPSKGKIADIKDPVLLAKEYAAGGARAISILTDKLFFGGSLKDLSLVATELQDVPIIRKDFIIDAIQIAEAIMAGADAVLLIVAVLGIRTKKLVKQAKAMGIDVLVEIHDQSELDIAIASEAEMIGINNRNLSSFQVNTQQSFHLLEKIPCHLVKVAESGIVNPEQAILYRQAGFDAVLIGEALVKSANPAEFIRACYR